MFLEELFGEKATSGGLDGHRRPPLAVNVSIETPVAKLVPALTTGLVDTTGLTTGHGDVVVLVETASTENLHAGDGNGANGAGRHSGR